MKKNNFPSGGLDNIRPEIVTAAMAELNKLRSLKAPKTDDEVEARINEYFNICENGGLRPGIETLAFCLGVTRMTIYKWSMGTQGERRKILIVSAKQAIASFIEQSALSGRINPVTAIFLFKNWLGYKDTYSFEENIAERPKILAAAELPKLSNEMEEKK